MSYIFSQARDSAVCNMIIKNISDKITYNV